MASKPGERRLQILHTLAEMLETPKGEKITTAPWLAAWTVPKLRSIATSPARRKCSMA